MTTKARPANHHLVVLALYSVGGGSTRTDTEDVAVAAFKLFPTKFGWRKYPDLINLDAVRVFLSDAKKQKNGALVSGSGREGWLLTKAGRQYARSHFDRVTADQSTSTPRPVTNAKWRDAERRRLLASDALAHFTRDGADTVSASEAEDFFRLDEYVTGTDRQRKVTRIVEAFGRDSDLGPAVAALAAKVRKI